MPSQVIVPASDADRMRLRYLLDEFLEIRETRIALAILRSEMSGEAIDDKVVSRILNTSAPTKTPIEQLDLDRSVDDLGAYQSSHMVAFSFVALLQFYSMVEIGLRLNLLPWPLPQLLAAQSRRALSNKRVRELYLNDCPLRLADQLRIRLARKQDPETELMSPRFEAPFRGLVSFHASMLADHPLRVFMFGLWYRPKALLRRGEELLGGADLDDVLGGRGSSPQQWLVGYFRFINAMKMIRRLRANFLNHHILIDWLYAPWTRVGRENSAGLQLIAFRVIEQFSRRISAKGLGNRIEAQKLEEILEAAKQATTKDFYGHVFPN